MRFHFSSLIVRSPLPQIHVLMDRVVDCCQKLPTLVDAVVASDQAQVEAIAKEISKLEGLADAVKNDVRAHMPSGLFLSVDRRDLLRLIKQIDSMADDAEDVGVLTTMRPLEVVEGYKTLLGIFVDRVLDCVHSAKRLVDLLETLHEAGYAGRVAADAEQLILEVARKEHEADKLQDQLSKLLYAHESELSPVSIFMWSKVLTKLGGVANHAENVADHFRLFIAR